VQACKCGIVLGLFLVVLLDDDLAGLLVSISGMLHESLEVSNPFGVIEVRWVVEYELRLLKIQSRHVESTAKFIRLDASSPRAHQPICSVWALLQDAAELALRNFISL